MLIKPKTDQHTSRKQTLEVLLLPFHLGILLSTTATQVVPQIFHYYLQQNMHHKDQPFYLDVQSVGKEKLPFIGTCTHSSPPHKCLGFACTCTHMCTWTNTAHTDILVLDASTHVPHTCITQHKKQTDTHVSHLTQLSCEVLHGESSSKGTHKQVTTTRAQLHNM